MRAVLRLLTVCTILLTGCSVQDLTSTNKTIDKIDATEVLALDHEANIFQHEGVIYKTNIDWVNELPFTKGSYIGKITKMHHNSTTFTNGMANGLPVGTLLFSATERSDILLAEVDGTLIPYLAIVEG
jgi:hypothetical protein